MMAKTALPYFDLLLEARASDLPEFRVFDTHVHWGYWPSPGAATGTAEDLREAMQRLDNEILGIGDLDDGQRVLDVGCGFGGTIASMDPAHRSMALGGLNIDARDSP